ncbi:MAG: hypothetical protein ACFE92_17910, partial [Promethearchaeota archaeon]
MIRKTLKVSKKNLSKIQTEMGWKGIGTQEDPIIIDSIGAHKLVLKLKSIDKHILLKNFMTAEIRLVKCRNITITGCKIYHLLLTACSKISVINCSIVHGYLTYSKENLFKNNLLQEDLAYKTLKGKQGDTPAKLMQAIYSVPIIVLFAPFVIAIINGRFDTLPYLIVLLLFPLMPLIDIRIKKHKTKNLLENIFDN